MVLVDTSVWSLSLRRAKRVNDIASKELTELIREGRVVMMGSIRQELLSGIRVKSQFELLRDHLRAFSDLVLESADYEEAAEAFNRCRERGIQGSNSRCFSSWLRCSQPVCCGGRSGNNTGP